MEKQEKKKERAMFDPLDRRFNLPRLLVTCLWIIVNAMFDRILTSLLVSVFIAVMCIKMERMRKKALRLQVDWKADPRTMAQASEIRSCLILLDTLNYISILSWYIMRTRIPISAAWELVSMINLNVGISTGSAYSLLDRYDLLMFHKGELISIETFL